MQPYPSLLPVVLPVHREADLRPHFHFLGEDWERVASMDIELSFLYPSCDPLSLIRTMLPLLLLILSDLPVGQMTEYSKLPF